MESIWYEPTREIMWNINHVWLMYVLFFISLAAFGYGMYQRITFWKKGKSDNEQFSDIPKRLKFAFEGGAVSKQGAKIRVPRIVSQLNFLFVSCSSCDHGYHTTRL